MRLNSYRWHFFSVAFILFPIAAYSNFYGTIVTPSGNGSGSDQINQISSFPLDVPDQLDQHSKNMFPEDVYDIQKL